MKTIGQYTDTELLELTADQRLSLIELQCALDGVPLLPALPEEPTTPEMTCDVVVYQVACRYNTIGTFETESDAQVVVDAMNGGMRLSIDYTCNGNYKAHYIDGEESSVAAITSKACMSETRRADIKDELDSYKRQYGTYDKLKDAYSHAVDARAASIATVQDAIDKAHERDFNRQDALAKYEHYLSIADGDSKTALKFFDANYSSLRQCLPEELRVKEKPIDCLERPVEDGPF